MVLTVVGIIVDEKNGSGIRHDNRRTWRVSPLRETLKGRILAYAANKELSISGEVAVEAIFRLPLNRLIQWVRFLPTPMSKRLLPSPTVNAVAFSAHICNLQLYTETYVVKAQAKLLMTNPLNGGLIHSERMAILRIDPTLDRGAQSDSNGTCNPAAGR